ncbi:hypothetical protein [Streptomyces xantholiticus]|uniref:Uncharacterized protein n=1 Tax=Streptomyces xantholiticus TaxID=68285 RepID=A0ABV1UY37_9ACTN
MLHDHDTDGEHTSSRRAFIRTSSVGMTAALVATSAAGAALAAPVSPVQE